MKKKLLLQNCLVRKVHFQYENTKGIRAKQHVQGTMSAQSMEISHSQESGRAFQLTSQ